MSACSCVNGKKGSAHGLELVSSYSIASTTGCRQAEKTFEENIQRSVARAGERDKNPNQVRTLFPSRHGHKIKQICLQVGI